MKSLIDNLMIVCDEIVNTSETVTYKIDYILFHTSVSITICLLLLIIIAINCIK